MSRSSSPTNEVSVNDLAQLNLGTKEEQNSVSNSLENEKDINEPQDVIEMANPALDAVILAALRKPQDRIFLLKLDLEFENFIANPSRVRLDFPQMNSYQRLIVHRVATYFKLTHLYDPARRSIYLCKNVSTEIPAIRFTDLIEKEEEPPTIAPKFQIMRRLFSDRGHRKGDVSPAESNQSSDSRNDRKQMTLEERKVAYEEARARIFQDFESNSAEGSEAEGESQASSNTNSPAIKAIGKKNSGRSTPDDSTAGVEDTGIVRSASNRGKPFTPRNQPNSKRSSPRDKENTAADANPYNRFSSQAQPYLPTQGSYSTHVQPQQPPYNSRNHTFAYAPYPNTVYDAYGTPSLVSNDLNANPNFANYWKSSRPMVNSTSIQPALSATTSPTSLPTQPLSRVWTPNPNVTNEAWSPAVPQDFPYGDHYQPVGMRPPRPNMTGGQLYNPNASYSNQDAAPFQDRRAQGHGVGMNGQVTNSNVHQPPGVWSTRPDNRDWGPLW